MVSFQDEVSSFFYYGTSHYFSEKPRHAIIDRVRELAGHNFTNELVSLYHTYSGYFDIEKLDKVLQKYEKAVEVHEQ